MRAIAQHPTPLSKLILKKNVTAQQHHICFVIGLLMCEQAHVAGLFRASAALLSSYILWLLFNSGIKLSSYKKNQKTAGLSAG